MLHSFRWLYRKLLYNSRRNFDFAHDIFIINKIFHYLKIDPGIIVKMPGNSSGVTVKKSEMKKRVPNSIFTNGRQT